jgi:hypothetical protein
VQPGKALLVQSVPYELERWQVSLTALAIELVVGVIAGDRPSGAVQP